MVENWEYCIVGQLARLSRYGIRFLSDKKYRNHVLGILDRQIQGASATTLQTTEQIAPDSEFLSGKRLFVAAGCDQQFMVEYLERLGMNVFHTFSHGRPSDPLTELMTPGSKALSESWDYYLLSVSQVLRGMVRRIQIDGITYEKDEQETDLEGILDNYRRSIEMIRQTSDAPIFLFSYLMSYLPTYGKFEYLSFDRGWSLIEFWHIFHLRLYELARGFSAVYVFDADLAVENVGKARVIDPEASNGIFDHASRDGAAILGSHFGQLLEILESRRKRVKCAVFDLDGTLWSGILREDGVSGVAVQEYYLNVMEKLHSRGILLAICSKNDPVERSLIPELIGRELFENVVSVNLTWQPKSQILRDIAEELNIGLDSLAFFDDSPFERAEVAANAPEVMVFGPEHLFGCLNRPAFEQPGRMTQESLTRTAKYKQQSKRKEAEKSSGTGLLEFLTSCQLKLELLTPSGADLGRVFELLQRTNQLNATLKRTSLEELKKQSEDSQQYQMMIARLRDKFGDYGLIGFASFKKSRECWQILDFAFSCRSAGRGVEQAILSEASRMARDEGSSAIIIDFCPGPRNQQMFEILKGCGFSGLNGERLEEGISIRLEYVPTPDQSISFPQWIELISP